MLVKDFLCCLLRFHGDEFVALGFEAGDDISDDTSLDSVGFDLLRDYEIKFWWLEVYSIAEMEPPNC